MMTDDIPGNIRKILQGFSSLSFEDACSGCEMESECDGINDINLRVGLKKDANGKYTNEWETRDSTGLKPDGDCMMNDLYIVFKYLVKKYGIKRNEKVYGEFS